MNQKEVSDRRAAIVCGHISKRSAPILRALRDVPEEPADSGWQFLCGEVEEDWSEAQVWSIGEVLEMAPSLREFIDRPPGTSLSRATETGSWIEERESPAR